MLFVILKTSLSIGHIIFSYESGISLGLTAFFFIVGLFAW